MSPVCSFLGLGSHDIPRLLLRPDQAGLRFGFICSGISLQLANFRPRTQKVYLEIRKHNYFCLSRSALRNLGLNILFSVNNFLPDFRLPRVETTLSYCSRIPSWIGLKVPPREITIFSKETTRLFKLQLREHLSRIPASGSPIIAAI